MRRMRCWLRFRFVSQCQISWMKSTVDGKESRCHAVAHQISSTSNIQGTSTVRKKLQVTVNRVIWWIVYGLCSLCSLSLQMVFFFGSCVFVCEVVFFVCYDSWSWILTLFVRVVYLRNTFNYLQRIAIPMDFHSVEKKKKKRKIAWLEKPCVLA